MITQAQTKESTPLERLVAEIVPASIADLSMGPADTRQIISSREYLIANNKGNGDAPMPALPGRPFPWPGFDTQSSVGVTGLASSAARLMRTRRDLMALS